MKKVESKGEGKAKIWGEGILGMSRSRWRLRAAGNLRRVAVLAAAVGLTAEVAPAQPASAADDAEILRKASNASYSLTREGMKTFRCRVTPDWDLVYKSLPVAPGGSNLLALLKATHFAVAVGPGGATVSRVTDLAPQDAKIAERYRTATVGLEQTLTGFFQFWVPFTFDSPVSDLIESYKLERLPGQYRISQKQDSTEVVMTLNDQLEMTAVSVKAAGAEVTAHMESSHTEKGNLLTGIRGKVKARQSSTPSPEINLKVSYKQTQGFELPETVAVTITLPIGTIAIPLRFDGYEITRR